jgi:hypothetical protein
MGKFLVHLSWHLVQKSRQDIQRIGSLDRVRALGYLLSDRTNVGLASVRPDLKRHSTRSYTEETHALLFAPIVERSGQGSAKDSEEMC